VFLPWLVLMETYYISEQENGRAEADSRFALLKQVNATILWQATEPVTLTAARLKAAYQISLADAIIAAFTIQQDGILLHKDPECEMVGDRVTLEALPYK
ncbi:MAG: PIN domain-containing protein, partial [Anaerolineae bacterium]